MSPDELRKRLHDCWYFTKDGCKCMYCESKHPKHHKDCPIVVGLAAADAWEAAEMIANSAARMSMEIEARDARIEALERLLKQCVIHLDKLQAEENLTPRHAASDLLKDVHAAIAEKGVTRESDSPG